MNTEIEQKFVQVFNIVFTNKENLTFLANHCSVEVLKNFRLVCRQWLEASLEPWRRKAVACIEISKRDRTSKDWISSVEFLKLHELPEDPFKLKQFPFRSFKLKDCSPNNATALFATFVDKCGHQISHIHLINFCLQNQFFFNLKLKNVKTIVLESGNILGDGTAEPSKDKNLEVTSHPAKHLKLVDFGRYKDYEFYNVFPNLKVITVCFTKNVGESGVPSFTKLRNLGEFYTWRHKPRSKYNGTYLFFDNIENYLDANPPVLDDLKVNINERNVGKFRDILVLNVDSIKALTLYRFAALRPINSFPFHVTFESIQELNLWGNVTTAFNFFKWMPNLQKLVANQVCFDVWERLKSFERIELQPFDFVKNACYINLGEMSHLTHLETDTEFSIESWEILQGYLPSLQILKIILRNPTFRFVCKNLQGLKQLKLQFGSRVDDKGITGLDPKNINVESRLPNLTDLKDLEVFEMMAYYGDSTVSDFSVEHAFLKMPSLSVLTLVVSEMLSVESEALLISQIEHVDIYRHYRFHSHYEVNKILRCCDRMELFLKTSPSVK